MKKERKSNQEPFRLLKTSKREKKKKVKPFTSLQNTHKSPPSTNIFPKETKGSP